MSSGLFGKLRARKAVRTDVDGNMSVSTDGSETALDVTKIKGSSAVNSGVSDLLRLVSGFSESIERDVQDQQEKTKDFTQVQSKLAGMMSQGFQKEKEFQSQINMNAENVGKYNQKNLAIEQKINGQQSTLRTLQNTLKEISDRQAASSMSYSAQVEYKDAAFSKALENKDNIIIDLEAQIARCREQLDKIKNARFMIEATLKEKEDVNAKLKDRIKACQEMLDRKKDNPGKLAEVKHLQAQEEVLRKQLEKKIAENFEKKDQLLALKEKGTDLEKEISMLEALIEKLENDLEDKLYLEGRIAQSAKSVDALQAQQEKITTKITKKSGNADSYSQTSAELEHIIKMIHTLNNYERTCQFLDDLLRDIENRLHILIEGTDVISSQHLSNRDKLLNVLGRVVGSTTGGLGYMMKHVNIEKKILLLQQHLIVLKNEKDLYKQKLNHALNAIRAKSFEMIGPNELEDAVALNETLKVSLSDLKGRVLEAEGTYSSIKTEFELATERLRQSYVAQVAERFKAIADDSVDCSRNINKNVEALKRFDADIEKQLKLVKSKERKDEFKRLSDLAQVIKDDAEKVKANLSIRKTQTEKSQKSAQGYEKMNLTKLNDVVSQQRTIENRIESDKKDIIDVETRTNDLNILFRDLMKNIIKEMHSEMGSKMALRLNQGENLQKKDQHLLNQMALMKNELENVHAQLTDDDQAFNDQYKKNNVTMKDTIRDEEAAAGQLRTIKTQNEKLQKQTERISRDNFNMEEAYNLIEQLDQLETLVNQTDSMLDKSLNKMSNLDMLLREMNVAIKSERIDECEVSFKQSNASIDNLKRLLDRLRAQLTIIEKDQNHMNDEFNDLEKKKETLSFKQETDKKLKEWKVFELVKDKYKNQIERLEVIYDEKYRVRDQTSSIDFNNIDKECDSLREEINKQVQLIEGSFAQEITLCKEIVDKMVLKYKGKKDYFNTCTDLASTRESELLDWKDKLTNQRDRIQMLDSQLAILGVNEEHEGIELYRKFLADIDKIRGNSNNLEKSILKFQERVSEESSDLEQMELKIVKTVRLEEIYKALEEIGLLMEGYEKEMEKFDQLQRQIEKEIEAFMNKVRSNQLFEAEQKIGEVEETINQLIKKLKVVGGEVDEFKKDISSATSSGEKTLANKDNLLEKSSEFVGKVDQGGNQRDFILRNLEKLKSELGKIDKKNVSMNEITAILGDAQKIGGQVTVEIKKMDVVQEELRALSTEWKQRSKDQGDRSKIVDKAKLILAENADLLEKMKVLLGGATDRTGQFEEILKTMIGSEDYKNKIPTLEKKQRRIGQFRADCNRFTNDKNDVEPKVQKHSGLNLESIQDLNQINELVKEAEKINALLKQDNTELDAIARGFIKRRTKLGDAELRSISQRRKDEVKDLGDEFQRELIKFQGLEKDALSKNGDNPEKQKNVRETLNKLKGQFDNFKSEYDQVADDIRRLTKEIEDQDLEHVEPASKLAKDIERLRNQNDRLKGLRNSMDDLSLELAKKTGMLSSMDTEKKLQQLLDDINNEGTNSGTIGEIIKEFTGVATEYNGYTSGPDDEEFFHVLGVEGQEQTKQLAASEKNYQVLLGDVQKLLAKFKAGGLSESETDELNDAIIKVEGRFVKSRKQGQEMMSLALGGQQRLSSHDLEKKIQRRRQEISEVEKIISDIVFDNGNVRASMQEELDANKEDEKMAEYCGKLRDIITETQGVDSEAQGLAKEKDELLKEWNEIHSSLSKDPRIRIRLFIRVLYLKRRIQKFMISIRTLHSRVKTVFERANGVYAFRPKVVTVQTKTTFKVAKGDEVDELVAFYLNKTGLNLKIERLGGGYYMFGTKKIYCKIINGKLVVRVGGGYMGMEEFIMMYGQQEINKYALAHGVEVTAQWTEGSEVQKSGTPSTRRVGATSKTTTTPGHESPKTTGGTTTTTSTTSTFKRPAVKK